MSDDLDDLTAAAQQRERDRRAARRQANDENERLADQVSGRLRGMNADDVARERAEAAEADRIRRLLDDHQ